MHQDWDAKLCNWGVIKNLYYLIEIRILDLLELNIIRFIHSKDVYYVTFKVKIFRIEVCSVIEHRIRIAFKVENKIFVWEKKGENPDVSAIKVSIVIDFLYILVNVEKKIIFFDILVEKKPITKNFNFINDNFFNINSIFNILVKSIYRNFKLY